MNSVKLDPVKNERSDMPQQLDSELLQTLQSNLAALQNDFAHTKTQQDKKIRKLSDTNTQLNDRAAQQDKIITKQGQKIGELNDRVEKGEIVWGKLFVENVSSQVLLVAAGSQPDLKAKAPKYFHRMATTHPGQLTKLNEKYGFESIKAFSAAMDASILKRNNTVHYSRVQDLEEDVLRAKDLFAQNARLKAECKIPFKTIDSFPCWKEAFAPNFDF